MVVTSAEGGKDKLWLAPLDRHAAPRQIPNVEGEQPLFGFGDEIFFRKIEGNSAFLYRVREDGGGLRKASDIAVLAVDGGTPDRKWLVLGTSSKQGWLVLFPVEGGTPLITQIAGPARLAWPGDRRHVIVMPNAAQTSSKTYVFPVAPGKLVPDRIVGGLPPEAEILKMPGVSVIAASHVVAGATEATYAFRRETLQRNLYRIPLP